MAKKEKIAIKGILRPDENIYWEGRPEKTAFILSDLKDDFPELTLRIIFDLILIPVLYLNTTANFNILLKMILILLWVLHLKPIIEILSKPSLKALEWKNTYYIITDKNIYIQFGTNQVYYRAYSTDRIGTKVFYRKNKIDTTLLVGTIGFSVDDYYEERLMSIKNYEDVFKILKSFASYKKEQMQAALEAEKLRQEELLKQQELLRQSEELQKQQEILNNAEQEEYEFESYESYKKRMQEEELKKKEEEERIAEMREREHEELIQKYNEYRKRHEEKEKQRQNNAERNNQNDNINKNVETFNYNTDADDSGIEDGVEIEFPVDVPKPPTRQNNRKNRAPKRSRSSPDRRKPAVEYGGVNGPKPKMPKPSKNQKVTNENNNNEDDDLDMSIIWESMNDDE